MAVYKKSTFEIITQEDGTLESVYRQIEFAGRTCYKSYNNMSAHSYEGFVDRMVKSKHYAMLEHGIIYLTIPVDSPLVDKYKLNPFSHCNIVDDKAYITTNYRVICENEWKDDLKYMIGHMKEHEPVYCVMLHMDRVGSQSVCRYRRASFAQESTRFCNFSKGKFGSHITLSIPAIMSDTDEKELAKYQKYGNLLGKVCMGNATLWEKIKVFFYSLFYKTTDVEKMVICNEVAESGYMTLVNEHKWTAENARYVLPLNLRTSIVVSATRTEWMHIFDERVKGVTGRPHPDIYNLTKEIQDEFYNLKYIEP